MQWFLASTILLGILLLILIYCNVVILIYHRPEMKKRPLDVAFIHAPLRFFLVLPLQVMFPYSLLWVRLFIFNLLMTLPGSIPLLLRQRSTRLHLGARQTQSIHKPPMGRVRRPPPREPHRLHRDRSPERHRLVFRCRVDRHSHLVSETETEPSIRCRHRVYGHSSDCLDLRGLLEKAERVRRGSD
jgi:hypothetical protein